MEAAAIIYKFKLLICFLGPAGNQSEGDPLGVLMRGTCRFWDVAGPGWRLPAKEAGGRSTGFAEARSAGPSVRPTEAHR